MFSDTSVAKTIMVLNDNQSYQSNASSKYTWAVPPIVAYNSEYIIIHDRFVTGFTIVLKQTVRKNNLSLIIIVSLRL